LSYVLTVDTRASYTDAPHFGVVLRAARRTLTTHALIDTGAAYSVFDARIAVALGVELSGGPTQTVVGFELRPLRLPQRSDEIDLRLGASHVITLTVPLLFAPGVSEVDNPIGRDVLRQIPFALEHGERVVYAGRV
jgi:hypothetical protein